MKKVKVLRAIFIMIGVCAFVYVLGVAGTSDFEAEVGRRLHEDSWYFIRVAWCTVLLSLSYFGVRFTEWLARLNPRHLRRLEEEFGKYNWATKFYRRMLQTFHG